MYLVTSRRAGALLLVAAVALAGCTAQAAPTPTPTSTPTPVPTASPEPSADPTPEPTPPTGVTWRALDVPEAPDVSSILALAETADGLVALGHDGGFGSLLWTRAGEGGPWTDRTPPDFASLGIANVTSFDGRLVGVGRGDTINVEAELAAVVLSEDGATWRPAATDMGGQLIDLVAIEGGLVAVGGRPGADSAGLWRSADGETWEPIGPDFEHAFLWSVAEGGPGLVAVGWRRDPDPTLAVWTSADGGATWELAPDPDGSAGFEAHHVVAGPDGTLVMVGSAFDGSGGRAWTSADGIAWTPVELDPDGGYARRIVVTPRGLVALGGRDMSGVAWISADSSAWEQLGEAVSNAYFTNAFVTDADGGTLLVAGATQEGSVETGIHGRAMLWEAAWD